MAQFMGTCQGHKGEASRLGTKKSGLQVDAMGWKGRITVHTFHNEDKGRDEFEVYLSPHPSASGNSRLIASGILDSSIEDAYIPALIA